MVGKTIGRFRLLEALGEGGLFRVYRAFDLVAEEEVAVHVSLPGLPPDLKAHILESARSRVLVHPNILAGIEHGEDLGVVFVVSAFVKELRSLEHTFLARGDATLKDVYSVLVQVCNALDYAHDHNILHCDVRPVNILLGTNCQAFLGDWGKSQAFDRSADGPKCDPRGLAFRYASPEQVLGRGVGPATDIYSLGVTLYWMLTGRCPFEDHEWFSVVQKHCYNEPFPMPRSLRPSLPEAVEWVVLKALAADPASRYKSAGQFASAFGKAVSENIRVLTDGQCPPRRERNREQRARVFVSYSHKDAHWMRRLQVHLHPITRDGRIDVWDDSRIRPGTNWRDTIAEAVRHARVAILLVSADFLASELIAQNELIPLLTAAAATDAHMRILPLIVGPSLVAEHRILAGIQPVNPGRPLLRMSRYEAEQILVGLAQIVTQQADT